MNVVINNKGANIPKQILTNEILKQLKKDLNVSPESSFNDYNVKVFKVYRITKEDVTIPIYYYLDKLVPKFPEIKNYKTEFTADKDFQGNFDNTIELRPNQIECYTNCINEFSKLFGGGIILMVTASGKTLVSLKVACFLKQKTLIVVNKRELIEQWKKEINKFIPQAKIGLIQGPIFDIEDKDIVLGMLQTISIKKELTKQKFSWCSIAIIDEIHNVSSEVFSNIMFKIRPRYLFGLTATLERKDNLHYLIEWYLGGILYSNISSEKKQITEIHIYKYKGESSVPLTLNNGDAACSAMLSAIANDSKRNDLIVDILRELIKNPERQILLISDRITQLKYINNKLPKTSGLFIGKMKSIELDESKKSQILLATYKLAGEGFSHAKLNCLVFGTSRSNINQAVGRIYRKNHIIKPMIVDIYDDFSYFKNQYYKRRKVYKELIKDCEFKNFNGKCSSIAIDIEEKNDNLIIESDSD